MKLAESSVKFKSVRSNAKIINTQFKLLIVSGNSENEDILNKPKPEENESLEFTYSNLINQQVKNVFLHGKAPANFEYLLFYQPAHACFEI